jgi:capsular exopolysaccharide synthesis family protein
MELTLTRRRLPRSFVQPADPGAVSFRGLRTAVDLGGARRRGTTALLFTGAHPGEGTSTVAANHALLTSTTGRSTLLIDAHLARPVLHARFGESRQPGLADVAAGELSLVEAIRHTSVGQVEISLLTAGAEDAGGLDVLGAGAGEDIITQACARFDVVVIDAPPILTTPDAALLGAHPEVDTVVVVSDGQRGTRASRAVTELRRTGASVIGVVVNAG